MTSIRLTQGLLAGAVIASTLGAPAVAIEIPPTWDDPLLPQYLDPPVKLRQAHGRPLQ